MVFHNTVAKSSSIMSRTATLSKETIMAAALAIVRKKGVEALSARVLGRELGCSSSPIFTAFGSMDELLTEVRKSAIQVFSNQVKDAMNYTPAFKEYGLRFIRFAKKEPNLFKLIFLNPSAAAEGMNRQAEIIKQSMMQEYALTEEQAGMLISETWIYGCGMATLISSGARNLDEETVSMRLSRQFVSVLSYIKSGKNVEAVTPQPRENSR
jgi:Bacterial regulatory proteins, tetR family.